MTEQEKREKREKVIKGLGSCVEYFACKVKGVMFDEWLEESRKAIALLKAQEPRVLTLGEARNVEVVWVEDRSTREIYPYIVKNNMNDSKLYKYGVQWRCWTSCPTDEQRKMTPWETGTANGEK